MIRNLNDTEEIWMPATTGMNLGDIMLSAISRSQKDEYCMISLIGGAQSSQISGDRKYIEWWFPGAGWEGEWEVTV